MASIDKLPSGRWRARVRRKDNRPITRTFERWEDATAFARRVESEQERGVWKDNAVADATPLGDGVDRYEKKVTPGKKSAGREQSMIGIIRDDAQALGILDKPMSKIDGGDLAELRDKWKADGVTPATIVRRMAIVSHLYSVARDEWKMKGLLNPARDVKLPKVRNRRKRRITPAELEAIITASESVEFPAFARLLCETAMRRGELQALTWERVNLRARVALLPDTKNDEDRDVPLSKAAVAILRARPKPHAGRVFTITADAFSKAFRRARARARRQYEAECKAHQRRPSPTFLVGMRMHDERHEATSRLADKLHILDLAAVTGHKDLRTLQRYYHADAKALAKKIG
jgi:integrase